MGWLHQPKLNHLHIHAGSRVAVHKSGAVCIRILTIAMCANFAALSRVGVAAVVCKPLLLTWCISAMLSHPAQQHSVLYQVLLMSWIFRGYYGVGSSWETHRTASSGHRGLTLASFYCWHPSVRQSMCHLAIQTDPQAHCVLQVTNKSNLQSHAYPDVQL